MVARYGHIRMDAKRKALEGVISIPGPAPRLQAIVVTMTPQERTGPREKGFRSRRCRAETKEALIFVLVNFLPRNPHA
jgi:hypothetical protein